MIIDLINILAQAIGFALGIFFVAATAFLVIGGTLWCCLYLQNSLKNATTKDNNRYWDNHRKNWPWR